MMTSVKNIMSYSRNFFFAVWKVFKLLSMPAKFESINGSSVSSEKV